MSLVSLETRAILLGMRWGKGVGRALLGLCGGEAGSLLRQQGLSSSPCLTLRPTDFPCLLLPCGQCLSIYGLSGWCRVLGV